MLRSLIAAILVPFAMASARGAEKESVLDHTMQTLAGKEIHLAEEYEGKAVLFVNVASRCGFTPQYGSLEALHKKYKERGLAVVGVPCNQFMGQEPGTAEEIAQFCKKNYGVTFDMLAKVNVRGSERCDLYKDLTESKAGGSVRWNFEKFLVSHEGRVVGHFRSKVKPDDPKLIAAIEKELAQVKRPSVEEPVAEDTPEGP